MLALTPFVLFDVDGTLVDSNDAHARSWMGALAEHGHPVPFSRIRPLIGMGGDRILPQVAHGVTEDSPEGRAISKRRMHLFLTREVPELRPTRGSAELLGALRERGTRIVIATSATRTELDAVLEVTHLTSLIDVIATGDDADKSKPSPDIIGAALQKAHAQPSHALMVGDTQYDVAAAHDAGVACVALRCGGADPATLLGADAMFEDPRAMAIALRIDAT